MDLDGSKQVCGTCLTWKGKREFIDGLAWVKPSAKGQCALLKKVKPPHGGCAKWQIWNGPDNADNAQVR